MHNSFVRITNVTIKNFKNIEYGTLSFLNNRKDYDASILGLYGQNGSGKTALIDALQLLKHVLCGEPVPDFFVDYINTDSSSATFDFEFDVTNDCGRYKVNYLFDLTEVEDINVRNSLPELNSIKKYKPAVCNEVISYSFENEDGRIRKKPVLDTKIDNVFLPVSKYKNLTEEISFKRPFQVEKQMVLYSSRSFVFSFEFLSRVRVHADKVSDDEFKRNTSLLESLVYYGHFELFVIKTLNTGIISLNALPLTFRMEDVKHERNAYGSMLLHLDMPSFIQREQLEVVSKLIKSVNIVLKEILPGLTILIRELGTEIQKDGSEGVRIELLSCRNGKEIPLRYESEGIRKIVSVLQLLIVVYNKASITVAIDELDSGVFEYLLGELLNIISENGKGQLIFTSHNLRCLETIDSGFIAFTTTNPKNRYTRMTKVKKNNNLRDLYYRDILLGEQKEELYEATNNSEIEFAFREAGDYSEP